MKTDNSNNSGNRETWEAFDNDPKTEFEASEIVKSGVVGAISGLPGAIPGAVTTAKEIIVTGLIDANVGVWSYVAPELTKLTGPCSINDTEGLQLSENAYRE